MRTNVVYQGDCIQGLKLLPDKSVDCIITDPPYGINASNGVGKINQKFEGNWDKEIPAKEYFDEILRVGKKVLIFGGNYFTHLLPQSNKWIVWDKVGNMKNEGTNFSDVELIWTNLEGNTSVKILHIHRGGMVSGESKLHPTQKPNKLMLQIIKRFTEEGEIILDPFAGSGSTLLACKQLNRRWVGFEISPEYCKIIQKRLSQKVITGFFDTQAHSTNGSFNKDLTGNSDEFPQILPLAELR